MATSIITLATKSKIIKARAGISSLPTITGFVFGNGGANDLGQPKEISENATALNNELLRKAYSSKTLTDDRTCRYSCTLGSADLSGYQISEIGLYDSDGDLVCIKNFSPKAKSADLEITFEIDDKF